MAFRHLTKIGDLRPDEVSTIAQKSVDISDGKYRPSPLDVQRPGDDVGVGMFEKPSLRTRLSFEGAVRFIGGHPVIFKSDEVFTKGRGGEERESVEDIAGHVEGMSRFIGARVFKHETIQRLARASTRSHVINLLCDKHHPMQALADVAMMLKLYPNLKPSEISVAYVGEWNNVAVSLAQACAMMGIQFVHSGPICDHIGSDEWRTAMQFAADCGTSVTYERDLKRAASGKKIIYGDTFVSMGDEAKKNEQLALYGSYQVTPEIMDLAAKDAHYLHCAPLYRGIEVAAEVADGPQAAVYRLGHMRLHTQVAVLDFLRDSE